MSASDHRPAEHPSRDVPCRLAPVSRLFSRSNHGAWLLGWALFGASCASQPPLPQRALDLNDQGALALAAGDLDTASARLSVALEYNPDFVDALTNLGLVEMRRANFERALGLFERVLRLNPNLAQPHHALGVLAEHLKREKLACKRYRAALRVDPGFAPSRANLARLLLRSGKANDALIEFRKLTEVEPQSVEGFRGMAEALLTLNRLAEVNDVLVRAGQAFAQDRGLLLTRGRLALHRGDYEDARSYLVPLVAAGDAFSVEAMSWLSLVELVSGHPSAAALQARRALSINPEQALPAYALAVALDELGDPEARLSLQRALALDPDNTELQRRLAQAVAPLTTPGTSL